MAPIVKQRNFGFVVKFCQVIFWPVVFLLSLPLRISRSSRLGISQLEPDKSYVIYSTHGSRFDPFFILLNLPFRCFLRLTPVRFFIYNQMFDSPLKPFLIALGCFPARQHRHLSGLEAAFHYLGQGQSVVIFPEGTRNRGQRLAAKPGITSLAERSGTLLIPVHLRWYGRFLRRYSIAIGSPFNGSGMSAEQLMDRAEELV